MTVTQVRPYSAAASRVTVGGSAVVALYGPMLGGIITNPGSAVGQGIPEVEVLFIDLVADAGVEQSTTTTQLQPGQTFTVPPGQTGNVSVNAATSGHRFSAVVWQTPTPYPPEPRPGPFPPDGPTSVLATIPSYLYEQYRDDEDLQAFVRTYNEMAQQYVDWFNEIGLPIYTGAPISGALLDWVAEGLYGIVRPSLSSGRNKNVGPLNTWALNTIPLNVFRIIGPQNAVATTDDIFKRIITWAFFKGDGKNFNVRWLKRRIMRFLLGTNGVNYNVDQTYQVSVAFGVGNQVNITLVTGERTILGGAILNTFTLNSVPLNSLRTQFNSLTPLPNAAILQEAIESGVLELPFQFEYVVNA